MNLKKCEFFKQKLVYLGFFISWKGLSMDYENVKDILESLVSHNVYVVRSFHDIANIYRKFK
jgi:hypothetical protein